jgi:hypothetical protein
VDKARYLIEAHLLEGFDKHFGHRQLKRRDRRLSACQRCDLDRVLGHDFSVSSLTSS